MRFTPTAFIGSQAGTLSFIGGVSGSYTSGGINYGFNKFTTSGTLTVGSNTDVDILVVGGGASGGQTGGGGGGVLYNSIRLYKGTYNVTVGGSVVSGSNGQSSSIAAYGYNYLAMGGEAGGNSGQPTSNLPGASFSCGGGNSPGGGGGSAATSGSDATCTPSSIGGNGANGLTYNMDGTASVYGSGGGGRGRATPGGFASGGSGGTNAGSGGSFPAFATSAINGFGGGGGGSYDGRGGGASGVVIVRYRL